MSPNTPGMRLQFIDQIFPQSISTCEIPKSGIRLESKSQSRSLPQKRCVPEKPGASPIINTCQKDTRQIRTLWVFQWLTTHFRNAHLGRFAQEIQCLQCSAGAVVQMLTRSIFGTSNTVDPLPGLRITFRFVMKCRLCCSITVPISPREIED